VKDSMDASTTTLLEEPLYGWMLRKSVWRKGRWSRRFFVLAPRSRALLYFSRGLTSRQVQNARQADPGAPAARGVVPLAQAVLDEEIVDEEKPYSFTIRIPGAEFFLAARSGRVRDQWIAQIRSVMNNDSPQPNLLDETVVPTAPPLHVNSAVPLPGVPLPEQPRPRRAHSSPQTRPPPPPPPSALTAAFENVAAEEHSECAVCFDELNGRQCGVLVSPNRGTKRVCRHVFHLDCLEDLATDGALLCPMCRERGRPVPLPNILEDKKRWFELLDVDASGRIESEDVLTTLKAQLRVREDVLDTQWEQLWDTFDLDKSGSLSYAELLDESSGLFAAVERALKESTTTSDDDDGGLRASSASKDDDAERRAPDLTKDKYAWFDFWDEDGSGSLDQGELLRALVHSFNKRGQRKAIRDMRDIVHSLLAACDVSGDGVISREEFLAACVGLADVILANFGFFEPPPPQISQQEPPPASAPERLRLEIRTNGGLRYSTADSNVTPSTTVSELREVAAGLHSEDLDPSRARLVHKGNVLRDDAATLRDAGLRDGDSLVLIVGGGSTRLAGAAHAITAANAFSSSSSSQRTTAPPPPPPPSYEAYTGGQQQQQGQYQCRVTVPPNAGPGSVLTIRAPHVRELRVTVPAGHYPGSSFTVQYDSQPAPRPSEQPRMMRVRVPPGIGPGQQLTVNVPGTGHCRVAVPQGVYSGMEFDFRLP